MKGTLTVMHPSSGWCSYPAISVYTWTINLAICRKIAQSIHDIREFNIIWHVNRLKIHKAFTMNRIQTNPIFFRCQMDLMGFFFMLGVGLNCVFSVITFTRCTFTLYIVIKIPLHTRLNTSAYCAIKKQSETIFCIQVRDSGLSFSHILVLSAPAKKGQLLKLLEILPWDQHHL